MGRRKFLKQSSLASSLFFVPSFVRAFEDVARNTLGYKRLVIVQLSGGNDGLNTVIPYRNDAYYKNRPTIGIPKQDVLRLTDNRITFWPNPFKKLIRSRSSMYHK